MVRAWRRGEDGGGGVADDTDSRIYGACREMVSDSEWAAWQPRRCEAAERKQKIPHCHSGQLEKKMVSIGPNGVS